jgi:hypothetical protein
MRIAIEAMLDYTIDGAADVLLLIEAAKQPDQHLEMQDLRVYSPEPLRAVRGEDGIGQRCWARGEGAFGPPQHAGTAHAGRHDPVSAAEPLL